MCRTRRVIVSKGILFVVLLILSIVCVFAISCMPQDQIKTEAFNSLVPIYEAGIKGIDPEITSINQQLYDAQVTILKLEQVAAPALKWVNYRKTVEYNTGSVWNVRVLDEGLTRLKNDRYQIKTLDFQAIQVRGTEWEFSATIRVLDLATGATYDLDAIASELKSLKSSLEKQRQEKLAKRALAIATIKNTVGYVDSWKVESITKNAYRIKGMGLGWAERLTEGQWTYHKDKKSMVPADKPSMALESVLSANL